jgi:hypothetical protein
MMTNPWMKQFFLGMTAGRQLLVVKREAVVEATDAGG